MEAIATPTFEQLPKIVATLSAEVSEFKRLLLQKNEQPQFEADTLLTVQQAANFLSLSVPTIYGLIHKGELPVMKRSKRCYFSKVELINYLKQGRKRTLAETVKEAETYLKKKGGNNV